MQATPSRGQGGEPGRCMAIIEITDACNLRCPVCFGHGHPEPPRHLTPDQVDEILYGLKTQDPPPEVIQVSGGEPTEHPQLVEILHRIRRRGFRLQLVTNGMELGRNPELIASIAHVEPTMVLQMDGVDPRTHETLRGRDVSREKLATLRMLGVHELRVVLLATVVRHVNEHEVGSLVDMAIRRSHVSGLILQPATRAGRFAVNGPSAVDDPDERISMLEIMRLITEQSVLHITTDDFTTIDCPDPSSSAAACFQTTDEGVMVLRDDLQRRRISSPCGFLMDWEALDEDVTVISMMHFLGADHGHITSGKPCCISVHPTSREDAPTCIHNVLLRELDDSV